MKNMIRKSSRLLMVLALLGLTVPSRTVNAAVEILPRADFPMCSAERMTYCISEVTFIEIAGEKT